jgi:uncharacterized membrane protein
MTELGWWMAVSPFLVIFTGLRVMRHKNRYRGRRRKDAGVSIFNPHIRFDIAVGQSVIVPAGLIARDIHGDPLEGTIQFTRLT